jgi:hypothetical protein
MVAMMKRDRETPCGLRGHAPRWLFKAMAVAGVVQLCAFQLGCATEEDVLFGDPERVAGGTSTSTASSTSSGAGDVCFIDTQCTVSWSTDIYEGIFNAAQSAPQPTGACGEMGCHESGAAGLFLPPDQADAAYSQITSYKLGGGGPYVVDCKPELSRIMCNLAFADGVINPYVGEELSLSGPCGSPMPKLKGNSPGEALAQDQLDIIAEWIRCGAPQN